MGGHEAHLSPDFKLKTFCVRHIALPLRIFVFRCDAASKVEQYGEIIHSVPILLAQSTDGRATDQACIVSYRRRLHDT
jgi:hypothetical protein